MLFPVIVTLICVGVYSINNRLSDVVVAAGFGIFGFILRKVNLPAAPLMLGFILGPMMEENFRRAMLLSRGNLLVLVEQPISAGLLACAAVLLLLIALPNARNKRESMFEEEA